MKTFPVLAALIALLIVQSAFAAGDRFSYRRVYELLYQFESLPAKERSHLEFRARVINPFGPPPAELFVDTPEERIAVPVDEFGMFTIPMSPQLAQLDPVMRSEPPAPLQLGLAILVRLPEEGKPDAAWLLEGITQANAAILARSRVHPSRVPLARGVVLRFRPEDDASVGVIADAKAFALTPDEEGRVELPLDPDDHADAVVSMTHRPEAIFPLFQ